MNSTIIIPGYRAGRDANTVMEPDDRLHRAVRSAHGHMEAFRLANLTDPLPLLQTYIGDISACSAGAVSQSSHWSPPSLVFRQAPISAFDKTWLTIGGCDGSVQRHPRRNGDPTGLVSPAKTSITKTGTRAILILPHRSYQIIVQSSRCVELEIPTARGAKSFERSKPSRTSNNCTT